MDEIWIYCRDLCIFFIGYWLVWGIRVYLWVCCICFWEWFWFIFECLWKDKCYFDFVLVWIFWSFWWYFLFDVLLFFVLICMEMDFFVGVNWFFFVFLRLGCCRGVIWRWCCGGLGFGRGGEVVFMVCNGSNLLLVCSFKGIMCCGEVEVGVCVMCWFLNWSLWFC